MIKYTFLLIILITANAATAQQLYLEGGKSISSISYENSQGQTLDNLLASNTSFMTLGYRDQLFVEKLYGSFGLAYAGYGAIGSDDAIGNFMQWEANYLEFNIGLDYEMFKIKKAVIYTKGTISTAFFLQGTQILNNNVINLNSSDDFSQVMSHFRAGIGFSHPISDNLSFYTQYMMGTGLTIKSRSTNTSGNEKLRLISNNISFGLLINIAN